MPTIQTLSDSAVILYLVAGLLSCFLGYKILRGVLSLWGLVLGFTLSYQFFEMQGQPNPQAQLIVSIVLGIFLAVIAYKLVKFAMFILGALAGYMISSMLISSGIIPNNILYQIGIAVAGGFLTAVLQRPFLILATAGGGAWLTALAISPTMGESFDITKFWMNPNIFQEFQVSLGGLFGVWVGLTLLGTLIQFKVSKPKK